MSAVNAGATGCKPRPVATPAHDALGMQLHIPLHMLRGLDRACMALLLKSTMYVNPAAFLTKVTSI